MTAAVSSVLLEIRGPVAVITLNRPDRRNAIDAALTAELRSAVEAAEAADAVSVIVLTGAGGVFSAGMDLDAYDRGEGPAILQGEGGFAGFVRLPRRKPCIAAVNGPAMGGGFEVMLACDLAIAEEHAFFSCPEAGVGLIAVGGGLVRLPRRVPPPVAMEVLLAGARIEAAEAAAWGLVNRVVPRGEALTHAVAMAERIAAASPQAVRASLYLARLAQGSEDAAWNSCDALWEAMSDSQDALEGPRAFVERRAPVWSS